MTLGLKDKKDIENTIYNLELKSEVELVALLVEKSHNYTFELRQIFLILSLLCMFVGLKFFDLWEFLVFEIIFLFCYLLFEWRFKDKIPSFVPKFYKHKKANAYAINAFEKFVANKTRSKVGVMFFVSSAEKYVKILVDSGIKEKIRDKYWEDIVHNFIKNVQNGEFSKGYLDAIESCSEILIEKFPIKADDKNELSNEVIEL